jgi:16S rRNA (adenine1518-N6/adenine1519-N6)-dimethyltransferase
MPHYAKKRLGQHFLVDGNACRRIVRAVNLSSDHIVLEIGPGRGALTQVLLETAARVLAVEIDRELVDWLSAEFSTEGESGKPKLIFEDILKTDIRAVLQDEGIEGKIRVFGNLPYNIATAVVQHMIGFRSLIEDMTFMLQREVVDRILSPPGNKQYGYLSVVVQYYCEGQKLFHLPPGVFRPIPKVTSTVVHLKFRNRPAVEVTDEAFFFRLVSALFSERRKTLLNNLKRAATQLRLEAIEARLAETGIDPARRAETLSLQEFAYLADYLTTSRQAPARF